MIPTLRPKLADPASGLELVDTEAQLTPSWIETVLTRSGQLTRGHVVAVKRTPIGNGMMGVNLRLDLEYEGADSTAPRSLVAKLSATRPESREIGQKAQVYLRETRFYQQIVHGGFFPVPRAYFADVSADNQVHCLLFEDLSPARAGDQLAGCGLQDAIVAIDAAADIHAPYWNHAGIARHPWMQRDLALAIYSNGIRQAAPIVRSRYASMLDAPTFDVVDSLAQRIDAYFSMQRPPWTVTHQDYRLDNMLFDARGGRMPVAVVDWQTMMLGPGISDVAFFIGGGLLAEQRREHEEQLVRRYHSRLQSLGIRDYEWDRCWSDYRLFTPQGLITAVVAAALTSPTERGDRMFATMMQRHAQHMIDHDTLSLIH